MILQVAYVMQCTPFTTCCLCDPFGELYIQLAAAGPLVLQLLQHFVSASGSIASTSRPARQVYKSGRVVCAVFRSAVHHDGQDLLILLASSGDK